MVGQKYTGCFEMYCVKGVFYHLLHIGWRLIYGKVIDQQRGGGVVLIRGHDPLKDGHAPLSICS